MPAVSIRMAVPEDASAVAAIYNDGIDERVATFNTEHVSIGEEETRIRNGGNKHPVIVAVLDPSKQVIGWVSISEYSRRSCYAGVGEVSIYVKKGWRGRGVGKSLLKALLVEAEAKGYWKLIGRIFVSNQVSRNLCAQAGFREIGILEKHGRLDGKWIDVVEVERLIANNVLLNALA